MSVAGGGCGSHAPDWVLPGCGPSGLLLKRISCPWPICGHGLSGVCKES
ncbi:putative sMF protein [Synechococcus sp. ROS8604]|nr:putative sMF protein [Synechococcus sp. ROS8604]